MLWDCHHSHSIGDYRHTNSSHWHTSTYTLTHKNTHTQTRTNTHHKAFPLTPLPSPAWLLWISQQIAPQTGVLPYSCCSPDTSHPHHQYGHADLTVCLCLRRHWLIFPFRATPQILLRHQLYTTETHQLVSQDSFRNQSLIFLCQNSIRSRVTTPVLLY